MKTKIIITVVWFLMGICLAAQADLIPVRRDFDVSAGPIAVGDFNEDGLPDVAVGELRIAGPGPSKVRILLNRGDGDFSPPIELTVAAGATSILVGDFNGDGHLDLAVPYWGYRFCFRGRCSDTLGNLVSILLGRGDGTFAPAVTYEVGRGPIAAAVGDFNDDGIPDLAVANSGGLQQPSTVSVLLGRGDGTFRPAVNYQAGRGPQSVVVADFNGDKLPDLAVASGADPTVSILLGNGDGTFSTATNINVGRTSIEMAVGDFNGDSLPDLVVTHPDNSAQPHNTLSVHLGQGDATFGPGINLDIGSSIGPIVVADLNGDGQPDLAVGGDKVSVLIGRRDGTFTLASSFEFALFAAYHAGPFNGAAVAVADFNGDDRPDLAVTRGILSIFIGRGNGTFGSAERIEVGRGPGPIAVGDLNRDDYPDLAVANYLSDTVSILLGRGNGSFRPATHLVVGHQPGGVVIADFNGDEMPDLAVANSGEFFRPGNTVSILLGRGDGGFGSATNFRVGDSPGRLVVADFNGDNLPDLATANGVSNNISILLGRGDGTFADAVHYSAGSGPSSIAVGDFNGDNLADLAVTNINSEYISIFLGRGDGTFAAAVNYTVAGQSMSVAIGDFNGDRRPDLAVTNVQNNISILLGRGDGTFNTGTGIRLGDRRPGVVVVADFDGDGFLDLAISMELDNVLVLFGRGDGTFGARAYFGAGPNASWIAVDDLNGDGQPDLIVANTRVVFPSNNNTLSILLGMGDGTFGTPR